MVPYLFLILAALGCDNHPVKVEILTIDQKTKTLDLRVATVKSVQNIGKLEGRATRLRGGISMELDYIEEVARWHRVGTPVAFNAIKSNGILYPADFNSLAMVSVYYNIEQAMLFFESIGMIPGELGRLDTYYWADVLEINYDDYGAITREKGSNNAFYLALSQDDRGFYVMPFDLQDTQSAVDRVPLSMNPGVVTHEFAHAVFQHLVYDALPNGGKDLLPTPYNYLWALNEGIADIFAIALTGDNDFITASISNPGVQRNAAEFIEYDEFLDDHVQRAGDSFKNPYEIGSFISATVYEIARRFQPLPPNGPTRPALRARKVVAKITYDTLAVLVNYGADNFVPADFFSIFLTHPLIGPGRRQIVCDVLAERFKIHYDEVEGCQ